MQLQKASYVQATLDEIVAHLEVVVEEHGSIDFDAGVCRKTITRAADLAHNIRLSTTEYRFEFHFDPKTPSKDRVFFIQDLDRFNVVDCKTAQPLPRSSSVNADENGRVGEMISTIHPALQRKGHNGGEDLELIKATVLVRFDREVQRAAKKRKASQHAARLGAGLENVLAGVA